MTRGCFVKFISKKLKMSKQNAQAIKNLRIQLPPYDSAPEIKELIDLQTVQYPENKVITENTKSLQQAYSLDSMIEKLDPEKKKMI